MFNKLNSLSQKINKIIELPCNIAKFIFENCFPFGFQRFQTVLANFYNLYQLQYPSICLGYALGMPVLP